MSELILTLQSASQKVAPITLVLEKECQVFGKENPCVFVDEHYTFALTYKGEELEQDTNSPYATFAAKGGASFTLYLHGEKLNTNYTHTFHRTYFFTEIEIRQHEQGHSQHWYTPKLAVRVPMKEHKSYMASLLSMVRFIEEQQNAFALDVFKSRHEVSGKAAVQKKANDTKDLILLTECCRVFEENFIAFAHNAHKATENQNIVGGSYKLRKINKNTVQFIANHPQYFVSSKQGMGIQIPHAQGNWWYPQKTRMAHTEYHYNIYENQIVISFLNTLLHYIQVKILRFEDMQENSVHEENGYISSTFETLYLEYIKERFLHVHTLIYALKKKYCDILAFDAPPLHAMPKPTPIFWEIRHYRDIFTLIKKWFYTGEFDTPGDICLPDYKTADKIYEFYCLTRLLCTVQAQLGPSISNIDCSTPDSFTFILKDSHIESVELYYQAEVQQIPSSRLPMKCIVQKTYIPDFILKVVYKDASKKCAIFDAKWKKQHGPYGILHDGTWDEMKAKYIDDITSTCGKDKPVAAFWLLQGKDDENAEIYHYYYQERFAYHLFEDEALKKKLQYAQGVLPLTPKNPYQEELMRIVHTFLL